MKRWKNIGLCVLLFIVLCSILGCGKTEKKEETKVNENRGNSEIENSKYKLKDDIVVALDNCNAVLCYGVTGNRVDFTVMTKRKLNDKDLKVTFDKDVEYSVIFNEINEGGPIVDENNTEGVYFTDRTCMTYNGVDWKKYLELEKNGGDVEKYASKYNKGYEGIIGCYFYRVKVLFDYEKLTEDCKINKIYIEYKNKKIEKDVNINLMVDTSKYIPDVFESTSESSIVETGTVPNNKGYLYKYSDINLKALKNVKIKEIKCVGDNGIEIENIDVSGSFNNSIQQKFTGDLDIKQGDTVNFNVYLKDKNFINQLAYNNNIVISMIYEVDGQIGENLQAMKITSSAMLDELYAYYNDGVDIMSYYNDYYNVVNGLN